MNMPMAEICLYKIIYIFKVLCFLRRDISRVIFNILDKTGFLYIILVFIFKI